jgi:hypothetical protein
MSDEDVEISFYIKKPLSFEELKRVYIDRVMESANQYRRMISDERERIVRYKQQLKKPSKEEIEDMIREKQKWAREWIETGEKDIKRYEIMLKEAEAFKNEVLKKLK